MSPWIINLIGIGRMTGVDDSGDVQLAQVTEGALGDGGQELVTDKVPRVTEFGFASVPPLQSVATMLRRCGERSRAFISGTSHSASRPRGMQSGDTCLYDVRGRRVSLTSDGVVIDAAGGEVFVRNASKVRCECDVETTGDLVSRADGERVSLNALHDAYAAHAHTLVKAGTDKSGPTDHAA